MSGRVFCIVAHPDDETMLTGAMLAMLAQGGMEIHLICATRGEGGEQDDLTIFSRDELGSVRELELHCAARALGIAAVRFLDYVDPPVGEDGRLFPYTDQLEELAGQIAEAILALCPEMVLTHGSHGEYGHPAHILTHQAVLAAHDLAREAGCSPQLYSFCAAIPGREDHIFNDADPADIVLDAAPWLAFKAEAAECHRTQHGLFFRHHPEAATLLEVVRQAEALHRVWPLEGPDLPLLLPYRVDRAERSQDGP